MVCGGLCNIMATFLQPTKREVGGVMSLRVLQHDCGLQKCNPRTSQFFLMRESEGRRGKKKIN